MRGQHALALEINADGGNKRVAVAVLGVAQQQAGLA